MSPKSSLFGWLTKQGRLKNRWARALAQADPARRLEGLREVQQALAQDPPAFTHLWKPFLADFLQAGLVRELTDEDFRRLEAMGDALSGQPQVQVSQDEVWSSVVDAYDAREEGRRAIALLTHMYNSPLLSGDEKLRCARDLAARGGRGDDQLAVYVDHLQRVCDPAAETNVLDILARVCEVDFESARARLRRAGEVARRLADTEIPLPGMHRALGLCSLLIEQAPAEAAEHFAGALEEDHRDRTALAGLLSAWLQTGEYQRVARIREETGLEDDPAVSRLDRLAAALQWLESRKAAGEPPATARDLEGHELRTYVGDVIDMAVGRLHLLEGNARRAAEVLGPLADNHPDQPRWGYYAAWAAALTGDRDTVARRLAALEEWRGRWTVACLLLDVDPARADRAGLDSHAAKASKAYGAIVKARAAMAEGRAPGRIKWKSGEGSLEEDLEALRAVLGGGFYGGRRRIVEKAMMMALFRRLPLADQIMWRGLHALLVGNRGRGRALLEESAVKLGYPRAALILSVHLLEEGRTGEAGRLLDRAAKNRTDAKVELLRASVDACEGRTAQAAERLERLAAQGEPKAHYALGNLYLWRAEESRKSGRPDRVKLYREQAAGAFSTALAGGKRALPSECEVLALSARFVAGPESRDELDTESGMRIWDNLEQLSNSRLRPWVVWNAALARLGFGSPVEAADACGVALELLEQVAELKESALIAVAEAVTGACIEAENVADADRLATMLELMCTRSENDAVRRCHRLGLTAAARLRYTAGGGKKPSSLRQLDRLAKMDRGNGSLGLLLARLKLEAGDRDAAAEELRRARPEDRLERDLCACTAGLLAGNAAPPEDMPQAHQGGPGRLEQGCNLLRAAAAFAAGMLEQGYDMILAAMRSREENPAAVVKIDRFLPQLCAHSAKGTTVPAPLVEAIRNMSSAKVDGPEALTVARCAAAVGEFEPACRLWNQVLAREGDPENPARQEFVGLLCHLAVRAHNEGKDRKAVERLRQAADFSTGGGGGA